MHFMLFILILFSSHFAQICQWSGSLWGFSFLPSSPSTLSFAFLSPGADDASDSKCSRVCLVFGLVWLWLLFGSLMTDRKTDVVKLFWVHLLHNLPVFTASIHSSICHHGPIATFQSPDGASFIGSRLSKDAQTDNQTDRLLAEATLVCLQSETGRRGSAATKTLYFNKPLNSLLAL